MLIFAGVSCKSTGRTTTVVKPKKHLFSYDVKWHKKTKRTKMVRMNN